MGDEEINILKKFRREGTSDAGNDAHWPNRVWFIVEGNALSSIWRIEKDWDEPYIADLHNFVYQLFPRKVKSVLDMRIKSHKESPIYFDTGLSLLSVMQDYYPVGDSSTHPFFVQLSPMVESIKSLYKPSKAASVTTASTIDMKQLDPCYYSPCCNALVLQAHLICYTFDPPMPQSSADFHSCIRRTFHGLMATAKGQNLDPIGLCSVGVLKEEGTTSLLAANLSDCCKLYCRARQDIESSLADRLTVTHQTSVSTEANIEHRLGITLFYNFIGERHEEWFYGDADALFPCVFLKFECTKPFSDTSPEASIYANVLLSELMKFQKTLVWVPIMGVTMSEHDMIVKLYNPTLCQLPDGGGLQWKIAEIEIFRCEVSADRLQLLVHIMVEWTIICQRFLCSVQGKAPQAIHSPDGFPLHLKPQCNIVEWDGKMYKCFDYRFVSRRYDVRDLKQRCDCEHYFKFSCLANLKCVVDWQDSLQPDYCLKIICYDKVEGSHVPIYIGHFVDLVKKVLELHQQGIVHGDLRFANVIFSTTKCPAFAEGSVPKGDIATIDGNFTMQTTVIDYDFSGRMSEKLYPHNFNTNIGNDGMRHPQASPDICMETSHDLFSLNWMLQRYEPQDAELKDSWEYCLSEFMSKPQRIVEMFDDHRNRKVITARNMNSNV